MPQQPRAVVLLCAGRGTRMQPLTEHVPKCMLPVGDRLVIDHLLNAIIARTEGEIIVVTGFAEERVQRHLSDHYAGRVVTTHNLNFDEDVNILSLETGVTALRTPEHGYLVVETDLLLEDSAWDRIFAASTGLESFWICKGYYSEALTGGIVHADTQGWIDAVDYQPQYDARYQGWPKMLGMLCVAPSQVSADRRHRQAAIADTVRQYYLMPWRERLSELPCKILQIDDCFAQSFNTVEDFADASARYLDLMPAARVREHF